MSNIHPAYTGAKQLFFVVIPGTYREVMLFRTQHEASEVVDKLLKEGFDEVHVFVSRVTYNKFTRYATTHVEVVTAP